MPPRSSDATGVSFKKFEIKQGRIYMLITIFPQRYALYNS